jgi:hypothetical protein
MRLHSGVEHWRGITAWSANHRERLVGRGLLLTGVLLLFFTLSAIWRVLLMGAAGAALLLFLQEAIDPTPLFWTAPWEAMQLVLSRRVRVNHIWLHRTQELARESIGSTKLDGFATPDGFVLLNTGPNRQLVQWTVEFAWRAMIQEGSASKHARGCKTVRFLIALWLIAGGLLALGAWRGVDLAGALLVALFCGAASHALARPLENKLGVWLAFPAWRDEDVRTDRFEVEPFEFPEFLWVQGSEGFRVRRISREELNKS